MPTGGLGEPRDPDLALDQTQYGIAIGRVLNHVWSAQASARACLLHLVVECGIDPTVEPDERQAAKITQANACPLCQRMTFRHSQDHSVQRKLPMRQLVVPRRYSSSEPQIQAVR